MTPTAFPLAWPGGWPKTDPMRRERSRFDTTISAALANLQKQVRLMGGSQVVLSSNYTLGVENPKDPGVVAYFSWQQMQVAIPCDRWNRIQDNVRAIALTIEAMRGMERWGAKHMIKAMFTGFKALPSSEGKPWWITLDIPSNATRELIEATYRKLASQHHPDRGGTHEAMVELNTAYSRALADRP